MPYKLVQLYERFGGTCYFHFQGTSVPSPETLFFRIKVSAGVRDKCASCTVLLTHALCAGATQSSPQIQFPVMLISGRDGDDECRPECDISGEGLTEVRLKSDVAGCPGGCRLSVP
jgi:hypothetical protein